MPLITDICGVMISATIYLPNHYDPMEIVHEMLRVGLVANASIDRDNVNYRMDGYNLLVSRHNVITVQTKALLFKEVELFLHARYGHAVSMYALPITQSNEAFDEFIRLNSKKV